MFELIAFIISAIVAVYVFKRLRKNAESKLQSMNLKPSQIKTRSTVLLGLVSLFVFSIVFSIIAGALTEGLSPEWVQNAKGQQFADHNNLVEWKIKPSSCDYGERSGNHYLTCQDSRYDYEGEWLIINDSSGYTTFYSLNEDAFQSVLHLNSNRYKTKHELPSDVVIDNL